MMPAPDMHEQNINIGSSTGNTTTPSSIYIPGKVVNIVNEAVPFQLVENRNYEMEPRSYPLPVHNIIPGSGYRLPSQSSLVQDYITEADLYRSRLDRNYNMSFNISCVNCGNSGMIGFPRQLFGHRNAGWQQPDLIDPVTYASGINPYTNMLAGLYPVTVAQNAVNSMIPQTYSNSFTKMQAAPNGSMQHEQPVYARTAEQMPRNPEVHDSHLMNSYILEQDSANLNVQGSKNLNIQDPKHLILKIPSNINIKDATRLNLNNSANLNMQDATHLNLKTPSNFNMQDTTRLGLKTPVYLNTKDATHLILKTPSNFNMQDATHLNLQSSRNLNIPNSKYQNLQNLADVNLQDASYLNLPSSANVSLTKSMVTRPDINIMQLIDAKAPGQEMKHSTTTDGILEARISNEYQSLLESEEGNENKMSLSSEALALRCQEYPAQGKNTMHHIKNKTRKLKKKKKKMEEVMAKECNEKVITHHTGEYSSKLVQDMSSNSDTMLDVVTEVAASTGKDILCDVPQKRKNVVMDQCKKFIRSGRGRYDLRFQRELDAENNNTLNLTPDIMVMLVFLFLGVVHNSSHSE
nr:uncharacterized protein LOC123763686 [Procambarus clarkii]XP_045606925.1 uncharacterized protein LOC123763686 [Procambarus clarkii]